MSHPESIRQATAATHLSRRVLLQTAAGVATGVAVFGTAGCQSPDAVSGGADRALHLASLAAAEQELTRLAHAKAVVTSAHWNWAQMLEHCAQSIEYSMRGFPEPKSALFQHTVGAAAYQVFAWRGRMSHDLAEPIPGAPAIDAGTDSSTALERLRVSIRAFGQWTGPLQPHFAYGVLAKQQYELAHAMHIANHLSVYQGTV